MSLNKQTQVQAWFSDGNRLISKNNMAFTADFDNVDATILASEENLRSHGPARIVPSIGSLSRALAFDPVRMLDGELPCLGNGPAAWDCDSSDAPIRKAQNVAARPWMSDELESHGRFRLHVFGA